MKTKLKVCAALIAVPLYLSTTANAMQPVSKVLLRLHELHPNQVPHGQKYNYRAHGQRLNGYYYNAEILGDLLTAVSEEDNEACCEILFRSGLLSNEGKFLYRPLNVDYSANMRRAPDNSTFGTRRVWDRDGKDYDLNIPEAKEAGMSVTVTRYGKNSGEIFFCTEEGDFSYEFETEYYENEEETVNREAGKPVFFFKLF